MVISQLWFFTKTEKKEQSRHKMSSTLAVCPANQAKTQINAHFKSCLSVKVPYDIKDKRVVETYWIQWTKFYVKLVGKMEPEIFQMDHSETEAPKKLIIYPFNPKNPRNPFPTGNPDYSEESEESEEAEPNAKKHCYAPRPLGHGIPLGHTDDEIALASKRDKINEMFFETVSSAQRQEVDV
jgi:hypothetical protein